MQEPQEKLAIAQLEHLQITLESLAAQNRSIAATLYELASKLEKIRHAREQRDLL